MGAVIDLDDYERDCREPQRRYYRQLEIDAIERLEQQIERRKTALIKSSAVSTRTYLIGRSKFWDLPFERGIERARSDTSLVDWDRLDAERSNATNLRRRKNHRHHCPSSTCRLGTPSRSPSRIGWSLTALPRRQCVLFSGEGAAGKSTVLLHLSAAHVLGRDWLGTMPAQGPAIFVDAEDDKDVMHRRLAAIASTTMCLQRPDQRRSAPHVAGRPRRGARHQ